MGIWRGRRATRSTAAADERGLFLFSLIFIWMWVQFSLSIQSAGAFGRQTDCCLFLCLSEDMKCVYMCPFVRACMHECVGEHPR